MEIAGEFDMAQMNLAADRASALMKTLGHRGRLLILCHLASGEKSVSELSETLGIPQSPLSQHLSRMRKENLVMTRREARSIFYSLQPGEVGKVIGCLYGLYCADDA